MVASMAGGGAERVIAILANQFVKRDLDVAIMMTAGNEVVYHLDAKIEFLTVSSKILQYSSVHRIFSAPGLDPVPIILLEVLCIYCNFE